MNKSEENKALSLDDGWTLSIIKEFIETLMKATLCVDINELKNHTIIECVWKKVGQDMKINHSLLKNFWYYRLHMQLFCIEAIYMNDVKIKLIKYLKKNKISKKKDINWQSVLSHFDGFTFQFLYRVFGNLVRRHKMKSKAKNLKDIINDLNKKEISKIIQNEEDKILPRLIYGNGNIKHIDIDVQEWTTLQNTESELSESSSSKSSSSESSSSESEDE